jgi:hypothetical protein
MKVSETAGVVLLLGAVLIVSGCVAAVVGAGAAGATVYMIGDLKADESRSLSSVYAATKTAANQLGLHITKDKKDAMTAVIVGEDAEGKTVTIKLKSKWDKATNISIRVGIFGNERKSMLIYQKIHDSLK